MATAIIILIIIALICIAIRRIYRTIRFGGSCCSAGTDMERKIKVKDKKIHVIIRKTLENIDKMSALRGQR